MDWHDVSIPLDVHLKAVEVERDKAMVLAREIQTYKDEKANELRAQIERERGSYATQADLRALGDKLYASLDPVTKYVIAQQGGSAAKDWTFGRVVAIVSIISAALLIYSRLPH
jgi:hypothetical protein